MAKAPLTFSLEPPLDGNWSTLGDPEAVLLLARLKETGFFGENDHPVPPVRVMPLDFYPGWLLCDLPINPHRHRDAKYEKELEEAPPPGAGAHSFLYGADGFTALDGTSPPIHGHNELHGIALEDRCSLLSYLRFFCFFVRGAEGPFEIAEQTGKYLLAPDDGGTRNVATVKPPKIVRRLGKKDALVHAMISYGDRLHQVEFAIDRSGNIRMNEDEVVASGVTRVPPLTFISTLRFTSGMNLHA